MQGNRERHTSIVASPFYSAFRIEDYGYTRMTVHNSTHLYLEQVSEDKVIYINPYRNI